ncbi:hypothetical protein GOZ78_03600 [Agrobacterium vitis]|uniref:hypothetical protein n=1 Tax=Agrobacterium vitis TaxID=373 RepID=UPI0012E716BB|nr:hypothetical protein [Agrobacterium vitis]MVA09104.1 hypothetical protein [Agrobacterium vitis]
MEDFQMARIMFEQQQGYMIAMRCIMTLLVAKKPVTVETTLALARKELEPHAFLAHKETLQSIVSDVVSSAKRLKSG